MQPDSAVFGVNGYVEAKKVLDLSLGLLVASVTYPESKRKAQPANSSASTDVPDK